jgi:hypothetical protein
VASSILRAYDNTSYQGDGISKKQEVGLILQIIFVSLTIIFYSIYLYSITFFIKKKITAYFSYFEENKKVTLPFSLKIYIIATYLLGIMNIIALIAKIVTVFIQLDLDDPN